MGKRGNKKLDCNNVVLFGIGKLIPPDSNYNSHCHCHCHLLPHHSHLADSAGAAIAIMGDE